jgi:general secretion pathway protein G
VIIRLDGDEGARAGTGRRGELGFSVLELLIVVAIIATLVAIAVPNFLSALEKARKDRVLEDLHAIASELAEYEAVAGSLPDSLAPIRSGSRRDPWGNPYQYLKIRGVDPPPRGKWRKDRFLVPINSDYDLYSMGPDGRSTPPLTAAMSRDDIIRAADGAFFGPAEEY